MSARQTIPPAPSATALELGEQLHALELERSAGRIDGETFRVLALLSQIEHAHGGARAVERPGPVVRITPRFRSRELSPLARFWARVTLRPK